MVTDDVDYTQILDKPETSSLWPTIRKTGIIAGIFGILAVTGNLPAAMSAIEKIIKGRNTAGFRQP